jgi:hypothetical protein
MSKAKAPGVRGCGVCGPTTPSSAFVCDRCVSALGIGLLGHPIGDQMAAIAAARRARGFERRRNRASRFEAVRAREVAAALKELNPKKRRKR